MAKEHYNPDGSIVWVPDDAYITGPVYIGPRVIIGEKMQLFGNVWLNGEFEIQDVLLSAKVHENGKIVIDCVKNTKIQDGNMIAENGFIQISGNPTIINSLLVARQGAIQIQDSPYLEMVEFTVHTMAGLGNAKILCTGESQCRGSFNPQDKIEVHAYGDGENSVAIKDNAILEHSTIIIANHRSEVILEKNAHVLPGVRVCAYMGHKIRMKKEICRNIEKGLREWEKLLELEKEPVKRGYRLARPIRPDTPKVEKNPISAPADVDFAGRPVEFCENGDGKYIAEDLNTKKGERRVFKYSEMNIIARKTADEKWFVERQIPTQDINGQNQPLSQTRPSVDRKSITQEEMMEALQFCGLADEKIQEFMSRPEIKLSPKDVPRIAAFGRMLEATQQKNTEENAHQGFSNLTGKNAQRSCISPTDPRSRRC
ncbi:MAG: hypothetical protein ACOY3I_00060 [Verrucomicrobiota bacterium]